MSVNPNNIMKCEKCYVQSYDLIFLQCENCGHMTDRHKEYTHIKQSSPGEYEDRVWRNEE